jgi:hypothetical protein
VRRASCCRSGTSESKPLIPTSIYAINKRDHEEMCLVTGAAYGIPAVALRFFNVYGPGQALSNPYTGVAAIFASRLMNRRPPVVFEDGHQSRDFTHVSDIVQGILLALESETAVGHAVNLGTGRATTVAEVAEVISAGMGWTSSPSTASSTAPATSATASRTPSRRACPGLQAKTPFEDGMAELIGWLEEQRANDQVDAATEELWPGAWRADARSRHRHHLDERGHWLEPCLRHGVRARRATPPRRRRDGQRLDGRHARAGRGEVPGRARVTPRITASRTRTTRARSRATRATSCS